LRAFLDLHFVNFGQQPTQTWSRGLRRPSVCCGVGGGPVSRPHPLGLLKPASAGVERVVLMLVCVPRDGRILPLFRLHFVLRTPALRAHGNKVWGSRLGFLP